MVEIINDNSGERARGAPKAFKDFVYVNEDNTIEISLVGFDPFSSNGFTDPDNSLLIDAVDPTLGTLGTLSTPSRQPVGSNVVVEWKATYTPFADASGTDIISFKIYNDDNAINESEEALITITIKEVNDLPVIELINNVSILEDGDTQITISYSDIETTTFDPEKILIDVVGLDTLQNLLTYTHNGNGTTTLEIDPKENEFGLYQVDVKVFDDDLGLATATFLVDVASVNDPPIINDAPLNSDIELGKVYSFQVLDTDVDDIILSYSLSPNAPSGMIISGTGMILWAPDILDVGIYENITVTVSDGDVDGETVSDPFSLEAYFEDCGGVRNGDAELDMCGDCNCGVSGDGDGSTCVIQPDCTQDCAGVWGGSKNTDD